MNDSTILVTGGAGYVGSRLVRDLAVDPAFEGSTIRLFDNMQAGRFESLADLPQAGRFELHEGDIMDPRAVRRALEGVDMVVHLAALVRTPFSFDHPTWTEHVNHWGTARLVEDCLAAGVVRFVLASSASVYGPGKDRSEEDSCAPIGPYSLSKLHAENAVASAVDRGLDATILRMATVYGDAPGIRFDAVPNRFAYLAAIGKSIPLHGDGAQLRPIIHVDDVSSAIQYVLEHPPARALRFNLVGENMSVREMARTIQELRPFSEPRHTAQHELARFSLSISGDKLQAAGWAPQRDLQHGMEAVLARYGRFAPAVLTGPEVDF